MTGEINRTGDADEAGKTPADIETDIARTRAELGLTIDALERKLAPRNLLEKGFDMIKGQVSGHAPRTEGASFDLDLSGLLKSNPVPLALIGVGLAWFVATNTNVGETIANDKRVRAAGRRITSAASSVGDRASTLASDLGDKAGALASDMGDKAGALASDIAGRVGLGGSGASGTNGPMRQPAGQSLSNTGSGNTGSGSSAGAPQWVHSVASTAQDAVRSAKDAGSSLAGRAGDYAGQAGQHATKLVDQIGNTFEEHPLLIGAVGVVAGAVVAALLPSTKMEDEWVGERRDELWQQAGALGREAVSEVRRVAEISAGAAADAAYGVAKDEADKLNLLPDDEKEGHDGKGAPKGGASQA